MSYFDSFRKPEVLDSRKFQTKIPIPAGKYGNLEVVKLVLPAGQTLSRMFNPPCMFKNDVQFTVLKTVVNRTFRHRSFDAESFSYKTKVTKETRTETVMSDTPMEIETNRKYISGATGNVLVAGLGLGVVARMLHDNPEVKKVTIVEIDPVIIELNLKHQKFLNEPKMRIVQGNICKMDPAKVFGEEKFDFMYIDIWNEISENNRSSFYRIKKKFSAFCKDFEFWAHYEIALANW